MANLILKNNTIANDVSLEFNRGTNASWRIVNDGGNLYLRCNYTTEVGDYYNIATFSYNSGEMVTKGRVTMPSLTLSSTSSIKHIEFSRAGWNYINIPADGTLAFSFSDATSMNSDEVQWTMTTTGFYPNFNNQLNLGSNSKKWANVYATNFVGALTGNADTASQFNSARTIALTGDVTGKASSTGGSGWSISTTIGANNHAHDASASWSNRQLTVSVGGGGSAAKASIPATLTGFTSITSATLIASTTMRIPVKASTYTSSTAGEIWIVA